MYEKTGAIMTEFSSLLKDILAEDLHALVLFGSAAGKAYNESFSDINVLIILEKSNAAKIFRLGHSAKSFMRSNRITPIIMTREEFTAAVDVFPLEYSDILETHSVVYGNKDILDITVNRKNLRLQLEEKLRGSVADLRSILIAAGGNEKVLEKLLLQWSSLGIAFFRGLLRLKEKNAAGLDTGAILAMVEKEYEVSLEGFSALSSLRQDKKNHLHTATSVADMLLEPIKTLVNKVYAMGGART